MPRTWVHVRDNSAGDPVFQRHYTENDDPNYGAPSGEVRATSAAEELAKELGVDLNSVEGTGLNGKITKGDVEAAAG